MSIDTIDPSENNTGALATALLDANVVQLYPANCWGDLWHNQADETDNNYDLESFNRSGRTFAYWMTQLIQNRTSPVSKTSKSLNHLTPMKSTGLGSETVQGPLLSFFTEESLHQRASYWTRQPEICSHTETTQKILPSTTKLWTEYLLNPACLAYYRKILSSEQNATTQELDTDGTGATNLTGTVGLEDLSDFALSQTEGGVERLAILWSDGDSQLPQSSIEDTFPT